MINGLLFGLNHRQDVAWSAAGMREGPIRCPTCRTPLCVDLTLVDVRAPGVRGDCPACGWGIVAAPGLSPYEDSRAATAARHAAGLRGGTWPEADVREA